MVQLSVTAAAGPGERVRVILESFEQDLSAQQLN